jgi:lipoate-protein ligase A
MFAFSAGPPRALRYAALSKKRTIFSSSKPSSPSSKVQIYTLLSPSATYNLSVENHLMKTTPSDSTVLVLFINRPSIVIGRNQNPWLETNLNALHKAPSNVRLVRRRSGGGTVFHDEGNVNWSIIHPPKHFDRNKHAEMVVRALHSLGKSSARVNERHDIVIDAPNQNQSKTFKISGSAYKLTRLRAIHHGTCLVNSPHLAQIGPLLRSPAEQYIQALGSASVRSPITNVDVFIEPFLAAVKDEFTKMYGPPDIAFTDTAEAGMAVADVKKSWEELESPEWTFGQTPKFTFSTHPTENDPRTRDGMPGNTKIWFMANKGVVDQFKIDDVEQPAFKGIRLYQPSRSSWSERLHQAGLDAREAHVTGDWMSNMLGGGVFERLAPASEHSRRPDGESTRQHIEHDVQAIRDQGTATSADHSPC